MRRVPDSNYPVRDLFGKGKHGFGPGDKTNGTIATIPGAAFMNSVQEEIANAIEQAGMELDPEDNQQLFKALGLVADSRQIRVSNTDELRRLVNLKPNQVIYLDGYHAADIGYGVGIYRVDDQDNTSSDNGITVFVTADGTRLKRHDKDVVDARSMGIVFDGQSDSTNKWIAALDFCRETGSALLCPAGKTLVQTDALDVSGVSIIGALRGYYNRQGTVIQGLGAAGVVLQQKTYKVSDISSVYRNLNIQGGRAAIKFSYAVNVLLERIFIENCVNGIDLGDPKIIGTLWNTLDSCQVKVSGRPLYIGGKDMANSNIIKACCFSGTLPSEIGTTGGYGAVGNALIATEFLSNGVGKGLLLSNTANTTISNGYFESKDTSITFTRNNHNVVINDPTFSVMQAQNGVAPSCLNPRFDGAFLIQQTTIFSFLIKILKSIFPISFILTKLIII